MKWLPFLSVIAIGGHASAAAVDYSAPCNTPTGSSPACIEGQVLPIVSDRLAGLCDFACKYDFCPRHACECTARGALVDSGGLHVDVTGRPVKGLQDWGLCAWSCAHGYCPPKACHKSTRSGSGTPSPTRAPSRTPTRALRHTGSPLVSSSPAPGTTALTEGSSGTPTGTPTRSSTSIPVIRTSTSRTSTSTSRTSTSTSTSTSTRISASTSASVSTSTPARTSSTALTSIPISIPTSTPTGTPTPTPTGGSGTGSGGSGNGSGDDSGVFYVDTGLWTDSSPTVGCEPPCTLLFPPMPLASPVTMTWPDYVTGLYSSSGSKTLTVTTTISISPFPVSDISFWPVTIGTGDADSANITPIQSIRPPSTTISLASDQATIGLGIESYSGTEAETTLNYTAGAPTWGGGYATIQPQPTVSMTIPTAQHSTATPTQTTSTQEAVFFTRSSTGASPSSTSDNDGPDCLFGCGHQPCGPFGCGGGCGIFGCGGGGCGLSGCGGGFWVDGGCGPGGCGCVFGCASGGEDGAGGSTGCLGPQCNSPPSGGPPSGGPPGGGGGGGEVTGEAGGGGNVDGGDGCEGDDCGCDESKTVTSCGVLCTEMGGLTTTSVGECSTTTCVTTSCGVDTTATHTTTSSTGDITALSVVATDIMQTADTAGAVADAVWAEFMRWSSAQDEAWSSGGQDDGFAAAPTPSGSPTLTPSTPTPTPTSSSASAYTSVSSSIPTSSDSDSDPSTSSPIPTSTSTSSSTSSSTSPSMTASSSSSCSISWNGDIGIPFCPNSSPSSVVITPSTTESSSTHHAESSGTSTTFSATPTPTEDSGSAECEIIFTDDLTSVQDWMFKVTVSGDWATEDAIKSELATCSNDVDQPSAWVWEDQGDGEYVAGFDIYDLKDAECVASAIVSASDSKVQGVTCEKALGSDQELITELTKQSS